MVSRKNEDTLSRISREKFQLLNRPSGSEWLECRVDWTAVSNGRGFVSGALPTARRAPKVISMLHHKI